MQPAWYASPRDPIIGHEFHEASLAAEVSVPELPEVETVVRDLRRARLVGCTLTAVWVSKLPLRRPWRSPWKKVILGRRVETIGRRGKWLNLSLSDGHFLLIHLGMSGSLRICLGKEPREL